MSFLSARSYSFPVALYVKPFRAKFSSIHKSKAVYMSIERHRRHIIQLPGHRRTGQERGDQSSTGLDRTEQDRTEQNRTWQDRQDRTKAEMSFKGSSVGTQCPFLVLFRFSPIALYVPLVVALRSSGG